MSKTDPEFIDWEDLSKEDQEKAEKLMLELNKIMDKYIKDRECEDSILDD